MWHAMFVEQIPSTEKILRTVIVYALVAVLIRLSGKRGLAGLNTLDIVVMTLLSNVVQNAIIGNDLSITGGAIGAATLVAVNAIANRITVHSQVFSWLFDGSDTTLIKDGRIDERNIRRVGLDDKALERAVRLQNGDELGQVLDAELEASGHFVFSLRDGEQGATKADVERLAAQLARIEQALAAGS